MKRILMISYYYPPLNDVGILRTIGFVNHLPHFGWQPIILTVKNPDLDFCSIDPNRTRTLTNHIVYRSRSLANCYGIVGRFDGLMSRVARLGGFAYGRELLTNLILVPDFACGWIPLTVLKGLKLISLHKIDAIFATCKPNSSAIIGAILSRLSGKPLVIDLRDPWRSGIVQRIVGNRGKAYTNFGERWKGLIDGILERKTLRQASRIVLTTQETSEVYSKLYPLLRNRFGVIYNGYADDFFAEDSRKYPDRFTIAYSGSYYHYLDNSEALFQALANIKKDNKFNGNIRFLYVGKSAVISKMMKKYNLSGLVHCVGYLGRKDAIEVMKSASVILVRNIKPYLSTKLFEGLASGIPILGLTGHGEAESLIRQYSPSSIIAEDSNAIDIEEAIKNMYTKWTEKKLVYEVSSAFKENFSKHRLTAKFAKLLDGCMDSNDGAARLNG